MKNKRELQAHVSTAMAAMAAEHSNDKAYASILQQFRTALLSDEYLAYTFIQDIHIYHQLNGMALNEGEHAYDVELPNPLTGEPLPGSFTITVIYQSATETTVNLEQRIDQDKMSEIVTGKVERTYEAIGEKNRRPPPVLFNLTSHYGLRHGAVQSVQQTKTVTSNKSTVVEECVLR